MITLHIDKNWKDALKDARLDTFEALMAFSDGECLSEHPRGKTNIFHLQNGQTIFVKQDYYTKFSVCLRRLLRFQRPEPNTEKERKHYLLAAAIGIRVPQVIAWGQERRWGLPDRGVMITLPVPGKPLDRFYQECKDPQKREQALKNADETLKKLQDAGLDWKIDCKPEHFFVAEDLSISLIDLERLHQRSKPLCNKTRERQLWRLHSLLPQLS